MYDLTPLFLYKVLFVFEILVAIHLFSFKLPKKNNYWLRLLLTSIICLLLGFSFPLVAYNSLYFSLTFILLFLMCIFSAKFVYEISWKFLFFICIMAYTTQHLSHEVFSLLENIASDFFRFGANDLYGNLSFNLDLTDPFFYFTAGVYVEIYFLVYLIIYHLFGRKINVEDVQVTNYSIIVIAGLILFIDVILNAVIVYIEEDVNKTYIFISIIYNILSCFMVLYIQSNLIKTKILEEENKTISLLLHKSHEQYLMNKENIELINLKCHDLKHQIREYGERGMIQKDAIKEIENIVNIYDSNIETGNNAIDLILSEKSLLCKSKNIQLTCIADCSKLDFISTVDIYNLFGNLIDNAIEAVINIDDVEKRGIGVLIKNINCFISITIYNYYVNEIKFDKDGLPITTKNDKEFHGFGMKSITFIVNKYNGTMNIDAKNGKFTISIMFPITKI